jgi:hypothetical protein
MHRPSWGELAYLEAAGSSVPGNHQTARSRSGSCAKILAGVVGASLRLKVECYAGYRADERPLRFAPQAAGGRTYEVQEILDQWHGIGYRCFKVRADDANLYILRHSEKDDLWTLDSFRRAPE